MALAGVLISCEKEEKPVTPASTTAITAGIGVDYENTVYFDLLTGEFVLTVQHIDWDFNVASNPLEHNVYLNSSNFLFVKNKGVVPFESVSDTAGGPTWKYDYPSGEANRSALKNLFDSNGQSTQNVYVVDRGINSSGQSKGFVKIMGIESNAINLSFRLAELDGDLDTVITVIKDVDYRTQTFDIDALGVGSYEPLTSDWHMVFTQYTDYDLTDQGDTIPYLVRGALINSQQIEAVRYEGGKAFAEITREDASLVTFSSDLNVIGYDWKYFDFDTGTYIVDDTITYLVREKSGNYYKMRFVGFYNDLGEKGYPMFELKGL